MKQLGNKMIKRRREKSENSCDLELSKFRETSQDLLSDKVDPAVLGSEVQLPLQPGVGADGESRATGITSDHGSILQYDYINFQIPISL